MKRFAPWWVCLSLLAALAVVLAFVPGRAQEKEDRTLLTWDQMRAIINEASGERAMHHVLELVPYPRVRPRAEYDRHFRESEVMERFAREYGYSNVEIETFPAPQKIWQATEAQLWMVQPESRKLYDIYDVAIAVCPGSDPGDVTAEVVDVGIGARAQDYAGKDVKGKIVLGSAGTGVLQRLAVFERGAAGILSYFALRPDTQPDISFSQSVSSNPPQGKQAGFGWTIAPRVGHELATRLGRGEKVLLRSLVKAETFPGKLEVVHATIPGDGSSTQEIIVSGHLYEGYIKQGANDDSSGCAVTLEMGRTLLRLVADGKLPRPKRTIHFLWVPEISGTNAWLKKHEDVRKKLIADLNFDMEGLGLLRGLSVFTMNRTPDSFPSFLNDVGASAMEFLWKTNHERVQYRSNGYRFSLPVVAPNGSQDPFYSSVDKHYGASDHVVYMNNGIPAVIFATWPDPWYHSSQDTPDKLDSTQFKRVAVLGVEAMTVLASADDVMAARVAAEALGRGTERMGEAQRKALAYLGDATTDAAQLHEAYKEARNAVRHQSEVEKAVVRSAGVLYGDPAEAQKNVLQNLESLIDQRAADLLNEVKAVYQAQVQRWKVPPVEPAPADAEKQAARLFPERATEAGGFGALQQALQKLPPDERTAVEARLRKVPQHMNAELNALMGQKKSVLEIRNFLSGEFEPLALSDLLDALRAQEKLGLVKIMEKPEEAKPAAPSKKGKPAKNS